jgi:hypothetical protein
MLTVIVVSSITLPALSLTSKIIVFDCSAETSAETKLHAAYESKIKYLSP